MEHRNQWKQVSLKTLEFFTEIETNNNSDQTMTTKKRTMQTAQKEADKRTRTIQLNFTILYHKYDTTTRKRKRESKK